MVRFIATALGSAAIFIALVVVPLGKAIDRESAVVILLMLVIMMLLVVIDVLVDIKKYLDPR